MLLAGALGILIVSLILILWRPLGIHEAWFAAAGAALMLAAGGVGWSDVVALADETGSVLTFLAGMLLVGHAADRAGVFRWAAHKAAMLAGGSGPRLFILLYLLGAVTTVTLSLDTTAVVLAPIVIALVRSLGLNPLPFVFGTTYVANTASLPLPVSNLTNLIVRSSYDLRFWAFAGVMALPSLLVTAANLALFLWMFRRDLPARFAVPGAVARERAAAAAEPEDASGASSAAPGGVAFRFALISLLVVLFGLGAGPPLGVPLWAVAVVGGAVMAGAAVGQGISTWRDLGRDIAWALLPFVFGLFVMIRGVEKAGLAAAIDRLLAPLGAGTGLGSLLLIAAVCALGSNLINNVPMLLVAQAGLKGPILSGRMDDGALYAALIGTNVGPNLTVVGSLATLLSLAIIAKKGVYVSPLAYMRVGLFAMPLLLLTAVFGLWLRLRLF